MLSTERKVCFLRSLWKKYRFEIITAAVLTLFSSYALLDTFVIPRSLAPAESEKPVSMELSAAKPAGTELSAFVPVSEAEESVSNASEPISVTLTQYRENGTTIYVADVVVASSDSLKTAFANNTYGKNVKAATSEIAAANGAVLAINGDFYGARNSGYVIRNGVLYRSVSAGNEDLVIYADGSFEIIDEETVSAQELLERGAEQVFSFGPALLKDGKISVTAEQEVGKAKASNPRTAIGIIGENHYVLVVSDGRTSESEGLSLLELAEFLQRLGVKTAYNLDGGGSSTMVYNGEVINCPTTSGNTLKERSVSDIVYFG